MEKKKVVLIGNHHIVIYNFRREFVQRLVKEGHEVIVFLPVTEEAEKIRELGCELVDIPVDRRGINPIKDARLFLQYKKKLKEIRPDMVFTYTIKPNIYAGYACRLLKIPYACTITGLGKGIENGGIIRGIIMRLYKTALKKVKRIFFQNEDNKKLFVERNIGQGRYGMVNGSGVNLNVFVPKAFPAETEPIRFAFVARIAKIKGIETFLPMVEHIKQKYPAVEFHMLGFWEEDYKEIITQFVERGFIQYHGMQADVVPYLEKCQCLVHPSQSEGMSNACLEMAAIGRAVIASDIPGCRECVEEGVTGYLHEMDNTQDLIEKIEKFILLPYNERKRMGELGRKKMEKEFSRELVVDAYMKELYETGSN
ncbi:MAG: glycosyltransferase family 4 protein [Lachnospiraceae bacterium]|nr:glycosyltransferase family 4 protein [Lachnospiraceae bacterium]MBQ7782237.1 glycosyltransferase family 4 protein [Lachnospiraceae bacterium]